MEIISCWVKKKQKKILKYTYIYVYSLGKIVSMYWSTVDSCMHRITMYDLYNGISIFIFN